VVDAEGFWAELTSRMQLLEAATEEARQANIGVAKAKRVLKELQAQVWSGAMCGVGPSGVVICVVWGVAVCFHIACALLHKQLGVLSRGGCLSL
jgi:hypothetical protein